MICQNDHFVKNLVRFRAQQPKPQFCQMGLIVL